jgi:effector-binding domain-containing protein
MECAGIWFRQTAQEEFMAKYDIVIKKVEPMRVVSVRAVIPKPPDQSLLWRELGSYLARQRIHPKGTCLALYHGGESGDCDWDIEVCQQIDEELAATDRIKVYSLPGSETMASVIHAGALVKIGAAYDAIQSWLDENQYQIVGPCREVCIRAAYPDGNQNDANAMTEIQYPVKKIE